jgi:hypothetical protein
MSGNGLREQTDPRSNRPGSSVERLGSYSGGLERAIERSLRSNLVFAIVIGILTGIVASLRLFVALTSPVVGPDYGHYLIAANWYLGRDSSGEGPFDPPFVPFLVVSIAPALGPIGALQFLGAVAAASVLPTSAFLMELFVPRWTAIVGATVFALWDGFTDFIAFGGVTNLFGIAFSLLFVRVFFLALEDPSSGLRVRGKDVAAALLAFSVVSVHHLTAFVTGVTVLIWVSLRIVLDPEHRRSVAWTTLRVGGIAAGASLVFVPYLFDVTTNDIAGGLGRPFPLGSVGSVIALTWRYNTILWALFLALGLLALLRLDRRSTLMPLALATLLTPILMLLTILSSHPVRGLYFEQLPLVFLACLWGRPRTMASGGRAFRGFAEPALRAVCVALLLTAAPLLAVQSPDIQRAGMSINHTFMTPQTIEALDWVRAETAADARFAVDGPVAPQFNELWKGTGLGWWLEGYANRPAIYEGHPVLLISQSKWEDARDANRLFSGETVFEDGLLRVADSFPFDDGASPMVYSAFLSDYHELVGLASPRLVDFEAPPAYPIILSANTSVNASSDGRVGVISGTYAGPGFAGNRYLRYDRSHRMVELSVRIAIQPSSGWDGIELTLRVPPRSIFDLGQLGAGRVDLEVATFPGGPNEHASVRFTTSNLSSAQITDVPDGIGLRWLFSAPAITLTAELSLDRLFSPACDGCPLTMQAAMEIVRQHSIDYLFVSADSTWNVRRFDRQPWSFYHAFSNAAVAIYGVNQTAT